MTPPPPHPQRFHNFIKSCLLFSNIYNYAFIFFSYTPEQVFDVVSDVDNYKEFLPWCHESKYLRRGSTNSIAKLSIGFPPLLETYTALVWTKAPFVLKVCRYYRFVYHYMGSFTCMMLYLGPLYGYPSDSF